MEDFRARLLNAEAEMAAALAGLDEATLERSKGGEGWTIRNILSHVSEMPVYWSGEVSRMLAGENPRIGRTESDERRLAALELNRRLPAPELIERAKSSLEMIRKQLAALSAEQLAMTGDNINRGTMSVADFVEQHIGHVREHAAEIKAIRSE